MRTRAYTATAQITTNLNWPLARIFLAFVAALMGLVGFVGGVVFVGGVAGPDIVWLVGGIVIMTVAVGVYRITQWIISKVVGHPVTLSD